MKKLITQSFVLFALTTMSVHSQVGVGTTTPVGKLTVDASADTTAALELVPQATPTTNLSAGQIAVIGDKAYMYDATRLKWLTLESVALQFGRNGATNTQPLRFAGNLLDQNSGPVMPFDGTIVAITAQGASGDDTEIRFRVRNSVTDVVDETFSLSSLQYINQTANFDFNAGDYIVARARNAATVTDHVSLTFYVKWRQ